MIGQNTTMRGIKTFIQKVSKTDSTVLITGETGTGKEVAAELIHNCSLRHAQPFVCINCTALPESLIESELFGHEKGAFTGAISSRPGKFELANKGTIFLDEIGDMTLSSQAKILRAIERKEIYRVGGKHPIPIDFRIIAATNRELENMTAQGSFRSDLFYRINIARINLPALRDRKDDIPHLAKYFISEMNTRFGLEIKDFTEEAKKNLLRYSWPGNARELKNIVESSFIHLPMAFDDQYIDLPYHFHEQLDAPKNMINNERKKIVSCLIESKWNKSKVAKKLNWSRMTVYRKMTQYNIVENRSPAR